MLPISNFRHLSVDWHQQNKYEDANLNTRAFLLYILQYTGKIYFPLGFNLSQLDAIRVILAGSFIFKLDTVFVYFIIYTKKKKNIKAYPKVPMLEGALWKCGSLQHTNEAENTDG